ncbi:MAG: ATP-dependent DNA helicase, partial [Candidatus Nanopelagicales bacterium]
LLLGALDDGTIDWPQDLADAVGTLGLANEIRAVLARAKVLGIDDKELISIGRVSGRPAWAAVGRLADQASAVQGFENVLDYVELLGAAVARARNPRIAASLQQQYRFIAVDEYQDTDRLQVELLQALVGPRTTVIAVGDPDQAIYGFRGADVQGLLDFPRAFGSPGRPAPIVVLQQTRRFGPAIRDAAACIIQRVRLPQLPPEVVAAHRNPACINSDDAEPIRIQAYDSALTRAAGIGQEIRALHLHEQVPWSQMAVLVRSSQDLPGVERALLQAGIPAAVAADEIPLRQEQAIASLLLALGAATSPAQISTDQALELLTGPMCGLDASHLRTLGRALRHQARIDDPAVTPPPADQLIRDVLRGFLPCPAGERLDDVRTSLDRLRALLGRAHEQIEQAGVPAEVLWTLWSGELPGQGRAHGWSDRLRRAALDGSRSADHDLDAVMALFDTAQRSQRRYRGVMGVRNFLLTLQAQQIPAEPVAARGVSGDVVQVLTAHRAKGQEWDAVWIIGLQEGMWPDLRPRGSVLEAERLIPTGVGPGVTAAALLAEERRLLYVAITRARRRCVLATVQTADEAGPQPSRFLSELEVPAYGADARTSAVTSLPALVAQLRSIAVDPAASDALREAAVNRLAGLAHERDEAGDLLVPALQPHRWWGLAQPSVRDQPVRPDDQPISLSGSSVESIITCPLRRFLERDVHADVSRGEATKFGSVVHSIAEFVAKGEVADDLDEADAWINRVWSDLRFEASWQGASERALAREALSRFLRYHQAGERALKSTEEMLTVNVDVPTPSGGHETVRLTGKLDRIEVDDAGREVAIDLKNMKNPPPGTEIPTHPQLGVYQLLLRATGAEVGGAALVQLRKGEAKSPDDPVIQFQEPLETASPTWIEVQLGEAAELLRTEQFQARTNSFCKFCAYQSVCPTRNQGRQVLS